MEEVMGERLLEKDKPKTDCHIRTDRILRSDESSKNISPAEAGRINAESSFMKFKPELENAIKLRT
jgi:hypothetical protein